ncbi:Ig-like domain-containing protein [Roseisolibacter sp. H3M3-2]|uniref:beta strand repeat-containing protein n=1 Tax=Roseisolibacter sp. H3M3-2 TaxID=3031323 RepID=UPI0023DAEF21|nr:Ig-like domain-containing protein [Roseisolibacter sp. H3M3-2]MDF1503100.1 Ig-like domain-containing protein [Roseisolibacter sp. H3M3-2]
MQLIRRFAGARLLAPLALGLVVAACDGDEEPSTPSTITAVTASPLTGRAGDTVTVTVRVAASNSRPLGGQTVTFAVGGGGGSVVTASAVTSETGDATTRWRLGNTIGVQTLNATVGTLPALTISANVSAGLPAAVTVSAGNAQTGAAGAALPVRPAVTVRDAGNNPVAGVQVNFQVSQGGGTIPGGTILTDAAGVATGPQWTLGPTAGEQRLTATVLASGVTGNPITFTATATAGAPAALTPVGNTQTQTATAGSALAGANLPAVTVRDAAGNPVQNVAVTFAVTGGGGTGTGLTATTNAQGVATIGGFTLGNTAGPNTITATAQGVTGAATFVITGTAGAAASATIAGGNNQSVRAGGTLQVGPSVRVIDRFGNPVAGVTVNFVVTGGGANVLGATQTTNAQGIATVGGVTLGATPGTATIEARVAGVTAPVIFTAIGLAGAPASITLVRGDSLTVQAFQRAATPFTVQLRDSAGFAVRNATVTFAIAQGGGGTLSATTTAATTTTVTATTDSTGTAQAFYTGTGVIGTTTVTATAGGLPPVTFTVTTVPNTPATVTAVTPTNITATIGSVIAAGPTVQLRDAAGQPVPGVPVLFNVIGATSVQFPVDTTDANGIASAGSWQLGGQAGEYVVSAVVSYSGVIGNNPIRFTANAIAVPTNVVIAKSAGDAQAAPAGSVLPTQVAVLVTSGGTPQAGITVQFIASGDGTATPLTAQTDAQGIARVSWKLATAPGANSLIALVSGSNANVTFAATGQ